MVRGGNRGWPKAISTANVVVELPNDSDTQTNGGLGIIHVSSSSYT